MLRIDKDGMVRNALVRLRRFSSLERAPMPVVNGVIVHQTGAATAQSTFNSYQQGNHGAHFLIDKDGAIYQTASLFRRTNHVGLLRSRCLARHSCKPASLKALEKAGPREQNRQEQRKDFPDRFPANGDSIGIELVGEYDPNPESGKVRGADEYVYVPVTDAQNASLRWLVDQVRSTLEVAAGEVYRHPAVSFKTSSEAATASW